MPSRCIPADTGEAGSQEGPCSRSLEWGLGAAVGCESRTASVRQGETDRGRDRAQPGREGAQPMVPEATLTAGIGFVMIKCFVFFISYFELVPRISNRKTSLINKSSALRIIVLGDGNVLKLIYGDACTPLV